MQPVEDWVRRATSAGRLPLSSRTISSTPSIWRMEPDARSGGRARCWIHDLHRSCGLCGETPHAPVDSATVTHPTPCHPLAISPSLVSLYQFFPDLPAPLFPGIHK